MKSMRKISAFVVIALMFVFVNTASAESASTDKFQYYKEIQFQGEGLRSLEIDPEIYDSTSLASPDIRIFDSKDTEVQYHKYKRFPFEKAVETNISFDIINRSDDKGVIKATFVRDSSLETYDTVTVDISGSNFLLSPKLYGSGDGKDFYPIAAKGYIYSFDDKNKGSNKRVSFDEVDYKYIRAEFEVAAGKISSADIRNASYIRNFAYVPVEKEIISKIISLSTADKITSVIIDTGYSNLPVSNVIVNSEDKNFSRQVRVLSGKDIKDFTFISDGRISSFNIGNYRLEKKEIKIDSSCDRYIKLMIENQDSAALNIKGADVYYLPENIVFEAKSNERYKIYYGSRAYEAPVYDMAYIADKIDEKSLMKVQLGPAAKNPDYKKEDIPFTDRNNYFMTAAIVLIVVVLGFIVIKNIKGIGTRK